ncbi:hypothetical protein PLESTM_000709300 [Pleodorina starrii]|nr:hypothetical protein PLESTM_000709300 [Pleodorina starrii]
MRRHVPSSAAAASAAAAAAVTGAAVAGPAAAPSCAPLCPDGWPLWCLLAACGAVAQVCENRTRWGAALSAPVLSMLAAVALAAAGVIPVDCTAYDTVWTYFMPLAAACFLLETDVHRLLRDGGPLLAGFAVGAVGMVAGAVGGWWLLREPLGPTGAKLAACLCASYVGGSVNFAAVALALQVPPASIPGAMAADNLLMAVFLAALMAVPVPAAAAAADTTTATAVTSGGGGSGDAAGNPAAPEAEAEAEAATPPPMTAESLSLTLAAAAAACAAAEHLAAALNVVPLKMLILAVVAAGLAAAAQGVRQAVWARGAQRTSGNGSGGGDGGGGAAGRAAGVVMSQRPVFAGSSQIGCCLMLLFFAVIGASAGSPGALAACPGALAPFLGLMVATHWVVVSALGRGVMRLPLDALLLGSNANIGGPATAAAMAAAKGWRHLVQPAMLTGSLGYATGTAAGLLVARIIGAA